MAELSPQAQAVLSAAEDAYGYNYSEFYCCADRVAAAALRAVADQDETLFDENEELMPAVRAVRTDRLLAIADELEGADD